MNKKGLPIVEPSGSTIQEYGIIKGLKVESRHYKPRNVHFLGTPTVPLNEFYSHGKLEDYTIEWTYG